MSWTEITRRQYRRMGLRYSSDLTDDEWALLVTHLPPPRPLGRPRETALREVVNAMLYILATGCQWRALPRDFPPYTTVQRFFYGWRNDGTWQRINHCLLMATRATMGREASPTTGIIDSQSVRTTEAGGPRGYDAGKKVKGRKRHVVTDINGLLVTAVVHEAGVQDRDGAVPTLAALRHAFPWLRHIFADGGYAGDKLATALASMGRWTLEIVRRPEGRRGFSVLPRRWVIERSFAWLGRNRRLAKDFETTIESAPAWLFLASVKLMSRRLAATHQLIGY